VENEELLIPYDLQFFGDAADKTEDATEKKLSDTRKKGQVAKSQELANAIELIMLFLLLRVFGEYLAKNFNGQFEWYLGKQIPEIIHSNNRSGFTALTASQLMWQLFLQFLVTAAPFLVGGFLVALFGNGLQFSFQVTTEPLKPSLSKLNPANGFKRIFSKQALINLLLSIAKIVIIFGVAYSVLKGKMNQIFMLYEMDFRAGISLVLNLVVDTGLRISLVYLVIGFLDFFYQRRKFKNDIKMTKQEVKDEYKDSEGDPEIKGRQKQRMREASQRRMMKAVPKADVVITNPTHIAVALQYDNKVASAPILIAKGQDYLAMKIKDAAKENNIEIVENKPLARAIYTTVEIGDEIPPELYQAVAEILAIVYNHKHRH
jgi:flagellar biosynthetic protein FlhB